MGDQVVMVKVDVDINAETKEHCKVTAMPTFKFYTNGKEVDSMTGANFNLLKSKVKLYNSNLSAD